MTIAILLRHAQTYPSVKIPDHKWPLSATGKEQAIKMASILEELDIDHIYSSPFHRCTETVRHFSLKNDIPINQHHHLRERKIAHGLIKNFKEVMRQSWDDFSFALDDCESSYSCQQRMVQTTHSICQKHPGERVLISSHGNAISLFLNHIDPSFHFKHFFNMRNPDLFMVELSNNKFKLIRDFRAHPQLNEIATDMGKMKIKW